MDMALLSTIALIFLPACVLPALVMLVSSYISEKFNLQSQGVKTFWSILITLVVLEVGVLVVFRLVPWVRDFDIWMLIGIYALGLAPFTLVAFVLFQIINRDFSVEERGIVETLQRSFLAVGITSAFVVFKMYEIKALADIIDL